MYKLVFLITILLCSFSVSASVSSPQEHPNTKKVSSILLLSPQDLQCANTIGNYVVLVGTMADGNTYVTIADINTGKDVGIKISPAIANF
jgi:hypothetical protein